VEHQDTIIAHLRYRTFVDGQEHKVHLFLEYGGCTHSPACEGVGWRGQFGRLEKKALNSVYSVAGKIQCLWPGSKPISKQKLHLF
jgi:hypothetical protein